MARTKGIYRRGDSPYWWIDVVLPDGRRLRQSAKTAKREEAEALLAQLTGEVFRASHLGIKAERSWQEAVVRYLATKLHLRGIEKQRAISRQLDPYLGDLKLHHINGSSCREIARCFTIPRRCNFVARYRTTASCHE